MNLVRHISEDQSDLRCVARLLEPKASYALKGQHWFSSKFCKYIKYMLLHRNIVHFYMTTCI